MMRSRVIKSLSLTYVSISPMMHPSLEHRHVYGRWCGCLCVQQGARLMSTEGGNASNCLDMTLWWIRPSRYGWSRSIQTLLLSNAVPFFVCSYQECSTTYSSSRLIAYSVSNEGKTLKSTQWGDSPSIKICGNCWETLGKELMRKLWANVWLLSVDDLFI